MFTFNFQQYFKYFDYIYFAELIICILIIKTIKWLNHSFVFISTNHVVSNVAVLYLFVYLAIHFEVAASLDTDSYICSDNGTNFIGAERELTRFIEEWNQSQIQSEMLQKNVDVD